MGQSRHKWLHGSLEFVDIAVMLLATEKQSCFTMWNSLYPTAHLATPMWPAHLAGSRRSEPRLAIFASSRYCKAWQSHDIIRLCKTETKLLFTWFNFVISPYAWLHVTCIHWEMSASWPGKTDNWQNVLCSYDPICAQIMAIKTWYYQNWDRYMCGFLITSTKYNICQFNVHRLYI